MTSRFQGSGRQREGGKSAVHLHDFKVHTTGEDFRHTADQLDMSPQLAGSFADPTVQGTLEKLVSAITSGDGGFISIGKDGYSDSATVDFLVTDSFSLNNALEAAFTHARLVNGGIILIKAGTYRLFTTVNVPAGISIMGEISGTHIIGATGELPMFKCLQSEQIFAISQDSLPSIYARDEIHFFNLVMSDNIDGYSLSGTPTMTSVPMIQLERGSAVRVEQVTFFGRMGSLGAGPGFGRTKTKAVLEYTTGSSNPSVLTVERCTVDGVKVFANLNSAGSNDKFYINGCKVRVFGTEATATAGDATQQCFINSSTSGEISITNNFLNSSTANSLVSILINIESGTPAVKIIGNTGSLNTALYDHGSLINTNNGAVTIRCITSGNNWDNKHLQNQWFLTIGDGESSVGDVTGKRAFDHVVQFFAESGGLNAVIVVNPGSYDLNGVDVGSNSHEVAVIGNKIEDDYPVFNLDVTNNITLDPYLLNKEYGFGHYIKSIKFSCSVNAHSIIPTLTPATIVEDCIFQNTSLVFPVIDDGYITITVRNCQFIQDGSLSDEISLVLPPAVEVLVENCYTKGFGYAMSAGTFGFANYEHVLDGATSSITVRNSTFDLTNAGISGGFPLNPAFGRYIYINEADARVHFDNCRIFATNDMSTFVAPIDAAIATTFTRFVEVSARDVIFTNCQISGPNQTFTDLDLWAMPALFVEPRRSFHFIDSKSVGALALQVSGANAISPDFASAHDAAGVFITNSQLLGYNNNSLGLTALDIDLNANSTAFTSANLGVQLGAKVQITGCTIVNRHVIGGNALPVKHVNVTGSDYLVSGVAQIYANSFAVNISDCMIEGVILPTSALEAEFDHLVGLVVDGYSDVGGGVEGSFNSHVTVSNNTLRFNAIHSGGTSSNFITSLWAHSPIMNINNNTIGLRSEPSGSSYSTTCIYIKNTAGVNSTNHALVTGNFFQRFGTSITHYVKIDALAGVGRMVDNAFDASSGTSGAFLLDSSDLWVIERNRNQRDTLVLHSTGSLDTQSLPGNFTIGTATNVLVGSTGISSNIQAGVIVKNVIFNYVDTGTTVNFNWFIPLDEILPSGVGVVSATVFATASATFSTTGTLTLKLVSLDATHSGTLNLASVTSGAIVVTPTNPDDFRTGSETMPSLHISLSANGGATRTVTINILSIQYIW